MNWENREKINEIFEFLLTTQTQTTSVQCRDREEISPDCFIASFDSSFLYRFREGRWKKNCWSTEKHVVNWKNKKPFGRNSIQVNRNMRIHSFAKFNVDIWLLWYKPRIIEWWCICMCTLYISNSLSSIGIKDRIDLEHPLIPVCACVWWWCIDSVARCTAPNEIQISVSTYGQIVPWWSKFSVWTGNTGTQKPEANSFFHFQSQKVRRNIEKNMQKSIIQSLRIEVFWVHRIKIRNGWQSFESFFLFTMDLYYVECTLDRVRKIWGAQSSVCTTFQADHSEVTHWGENEVEIFLVSDNFANDFFLFRSPVCFYSFWATLQEQSGIDEFLPSSCHTAKIFGNSTPVKNGLFRFLG